MAPANAEHLPSPTTPRRGRAPFASPVLRTYTLAGEHATWRRYLMELCLIAGLVVPWAAPAVGLLVVTPLVRVTADAGAELGPGTACLGPGVQVRGWECVGRGEGKRATEEPWGRRACPPGRRAGRHPPHTRALTSPLQECSQPISMDYYFWNVTNPSEAGGGGMGRGGRAAGALREGGPAGAQAGRRPSHATTTLIPTLRRSGARVPAPYCKKSALTRSRCGQENAKEAGRREGRPGPPPTRPTPATLPAGPRSPGRRVLLPRRPQCHLHSVLPPSL